MERGVGRVDDIWQCFTFMYSSEPVNYCQGQAGCFVTTRTQLREIFWPRELCVWIVFSITACSETPAFLIKMRNHKSNSQSSALQVRFNNKLEIQKHVTTIQEEFEITPTTEQLSQLK